LACVEEQKNVSFSNFGAPKIAFYIDHQKYLFSRNFVSEPKMSRCTPRYFNFFRHLEICFLIVGASISMNQSGFPFGQLAIDFWWQSYKYPG
jgi:hypothetical protein